MKKKKGAYPSKTTLNLAIKEKSPFAPIRLVPPLLLLLVLAAAIGKFGVADRLAAVERAESELAVILARQEELTEATAGFEELEALYSQYSTGWMTENEQAAVLRTEMLDLVETELMPESQVRRLSASGNILSVELSGVTLEGSARFVQALYQRPDVTNVVVYTASSKEEETAVTMIITMHLPKEGGKGS